MAIILKVGFNALQAEREVITIGNKAVMVTRAESFNALQAEREVITSHEVKHKDHHELKVSMPYRQKERL